MSESAMAEEIAGASTKWDCDNVKIRRDRTGNAESEQPARNGRRRKNSQKAAAATPWEKMVGIGLL